MGGTGFSREAFYDSTSTIPNFYTPELTPDTWLLPRSRAEILRWPLLEGEKVWCNGKFVAIEDIKIGDEVLSSNGYKQTVLNTMSKDADDYGVEITTRFAPPVQFGGNHPIWAVDTNKGSEYVSKCYRTCLYNNAISFDSVAKWYDAKDIKPGFMVKIPKYKITIDNPIDISEYLPEETVRGYRFEVSEDTIHYYLGKHSGDSPRFLPLDSRMFEFLGWYVAEGHVKQNTVVLTLSNDELLVAEKLREDIKDLFNLNDECAYIIPHNGAYRLCINNPVLASFILKCFNTGSKDKHIPQWLLDSNVSNIISFLRGWIQGDGKVVNEAIHDQTSGFLLTTTSEQLSKMGYMLFNKVGCIVGVKETHQTLEEAQKKAGFHCTIKSCAPVVYALSANGNRVKVLFPELQYTDKVCPNFYEDENYYYTTVRDVKIFETNKKFYCVTTEDHTICVPYITHNCRLFFNLDPYINSILTMHAQYPICNFRLKYKDKETEAFFNRKLFDNKEFSWVDFLEQIMLSYWKLGEAVVWGDFNEAKGTWNNFSLIDPSLIEYKEDPVSGEVEMSIIPTRELKQMLAEGLKQGRNDIPVEYIKCVQENQKIPLDATGTEPNYLTGRKYSPAKVFMLARKTDPGATRGTPIIQSLFKTLIYSDKIRLAQIAIADRLHLPMEIWTIGEYTGDPNTSIIPDDGMITNVREAIREATMQPPFSIFVPPYIKYEAVGVNGKLLSVYEDLGYVENCIFVALGVNKNLILGQGPSFSSSKQTSLFKLIKTYKMMRLKLEAFIKRYIILPIAKANDVKDEYGDYVVPDIEWEESLNPEQDVEKFNNVLKLWDKGLVSTTTLYEYFPGKLDINLEKQRMEEEKLTIFDKGTERLGAKQFRSDIKENNGNGGKNPKPSDGSKPATNLPPPMEGDVKEEPEEPTNSDNTEEGSELEEQQGE